MLSDKELEELERKLKAVRDIKAKYGYPKHGMVMVPDDKVAEFMSSINLPNSFDATGTKLAIISLPFFHIIFLLC